MREVMSSILGQDPFIGQDPIIIISTGRGDIAQLVERLLSINADFFFEPYSQHPPLRALQGFGGRRSAEQAHKGFYKIVLPQTTKKGGRAH